VEKRGGERVGAVRAFMQNASYLQLATDAWERHLGAVIHICTEQLLEFRCMDMAKMSWEFFSGCHLLFACATDGWDLEGFVFLGWKK
jgi:hypothetical protein